MKMNCLQVATSICCWLVISCIILPKTATGQPTLNQNEIINVGALLPLGPHDSFVYIWDLDDCIFEYTELIVIIEKDINERKALNQEAFHLTQIRHHQPKIFALVLIGSKTFIRTPRLFNDFCEDDELGVCYFTEIWTFIVTQNPGWNKFDLLSSTNPLLLAHISPNDSYTRTSFILHSHRRSEIHPCKIDAHNCVLEVWKRYLSVLRMRQTCMKVLDPEWRIHRAAASKLMPIVGCHDDYSMQKSTPFFEVLPRMQSASGIYPEVNDFIVSTRESTLLYIISPTTAEKSRNPYTSALESSTWTFLAISLFLCGLFAFISQSKNESWERLSAAWLFCIRLALDQQSSSMKPKKFVAFVGISAMLLTNLYRCYLSSEFTVEETGIPNNISSIADLLYTNSNISIVFADDYCQVVKKHRSGEGRMDICLELGGDFDQCGLLNQLDILDSTLAFKKLALPKRLKKLKGCTSVLAICTSEIQNVLADSMSSDQVLPAFLTSQSDFPSTWHAISRGIEDFREVRYTYKLDAKTSYFSPIWGIQFPMRLKSSQQWIRRNLRAVVDSGILTKGANANFTRTNRRLESSLMASESEFQPISLSKSWLLVVVQLCSICFATSAVVFALELISTRKKACTLILHVASEQVVRPGRLASGILQKLETLDVFISQICKPIPTWNPPKLLGFICFLSSIYRHLKTRRTI